MKWSELRRIAIKYGWQLKRQGARHEVLEHPDKDFCIEIGRHGSEEIRTGTFMKLKKQIGF